MTIAEKKVFSKIISENTIEVPYTVSKSKGKTEKRKLEIRPKIREVSIKSKNLVYVPIWIIAIKSGDFIYNRKVLAASHTVIKDDIVFCLNHSAMRRKQTSAVCEICRLALCNDHIFPINNSYYCATHRPSNEI